MRAAWNRPARVLAGQLGYGTQQLHDQRDSDLCDGVGGGCRRVEHGDAQFAGCGSVYMVHAYAGDADDAQTLSGGQYGARDACMRARDHCVAVSDTLAERGFVNRLWAHDFACRLKPLRSVGVQALS